MSITLETLHDFPDISAKFERTHPLEFETMPRYEIKSVKKRVTNVQEEGFGPE